MTDTARWRINVAHILVKEEQLARQCIAWIEETEPELQHDCFVNLAKMHSICGSFEFGGDLGLIRDGETHRPFEQAMCRLRPLEWTREPVETPAGWHVIMRIK